MARLKNLIVSVTVDNKELPEFEDEDDEDPSPDKSSKYVEAASGANFQVLFERKEKFHHYGGVGLQFRVYLDGKVMDNTILQGDRTVISLNGVREYNKDQWTVERFRFSDITISLSLLQ